MSLQLCVPGQQRGGWGEAGGPPGGCLLFSLGEVAFLLHSDPLIQIHSLPITMHSAPQGQYPQPLCRLGQQRHLFPSLLHEPLSILTVPSPKQILSLSASPRFQEDHPLSSAVGITTACSPWRAQSPTRVHLLRCRGDQVSPLLQSLTLQWHPTAERRKSRLHGLI